MLIQSFKSFDYKNILFIKTTTNLQESILYQHTFPLYIGCNLTILITNFSSFKGVSKPASSSAPTITMVIAKEENNTIPQSARVS